MIKNFFLGVVVVSMIFLSSSVFAKGLLSDNGFSASGSLGVYSKYVWRGFKLDGDPVIQPGFDISGYGVTLSMWSSFDADNKDELNSDELDYIIDYTKDFEKFSLSVGNTFYTFPESDLRSEEFYIGASFSTLLSPSLTIYYDYGDEADGGADGYYIVLSGSHSFVLANDITFDLGGSVGYNSELFIAGEGEDVLLSAGFTIPLTENLTFSPMIAYSMPFGDLENEADGNQDKEFYGGFSLGYSF